MLLAGFQKTSFIDYPGKIASVFFTSGCNFRCVYCHNWQLISGEIGSKEIEKKAFEWLKEKKNILEGVSITGGEPTLQPDLLDFVKKIKKMGFSVKVDTNGYRPEIVEKLIESKDVDYIAMDMKAPYNRYSEIVGVEVDIEKIKKSVGLIINSGIEHEFRTTAYPKLKEDDYKQIKEQIKGAKNYYIQQFNNEHTPKELGKIEPLSLSKLEEFCKIVRDAVRRCKIRY